MIPSVRSGRLALTHSAADILGCIEQAFLVLADVKAQVDMMVQADTMERADRQHNNPSHRIDAAELDAEVVVDAARGISADFPLAVDIQPYIVGCAENDRSTAGIAAHIAVDRDPAHNVHCKCRRWEYVALALANLVCVPAQLAQDHDRRRFDGELQDFHSCYDGSVDIHAGYYAVYIFQYADLYLQIDKQKMINTLLITWDINQIGYRTKWHIDGYILCSSTNCYLYFLIAFNLTHDIYLHVLWVL